MNIIYYFISFILILIFLGIIPNLPVDFFYVLVELLPLSVKIKRSIKYLINILVTKLNSKYSKTVANSKYSKPTFHSFVIHSLRAYSSLSGIPTSINFA